MVGALPLAHARFSAIECVPVIRLARLGSTETITLLTESGVLLGRLNTCVAGHSAEFALQKSNAILPSGLLGTAWC